MASKQQQRSGKGSGPNGRLTKSERRDQARRQREEMRRKMQRARRNRRIATVAIVAAVVAAGVWLYTTGDDEGEPTGPLPGLLTGTAPWPNNVDELGDRLGELGLPPVGGALHLHSHLSVFVDGEQVPVPSDIGISGSLHAPLHSHDETGVLHVESANPSSTFTLGDYFDVWGVRLTPTCIGGYCKQGQKSLHVFVDGEEYAGDPRQIELTDREEITIAYGTDEDVPDPLPTYDWGELVA